jgi:hypothetical protein
MTLKEKFEDVEVMFEGQHGFLGYDELLEASDRCVEIADDFAIRFAEWCAKNELFYSIQYGRIKAEQLLKIYKKEEVLWK